MIVRARSRGLSHFRTLVQGFSEGVLEGRGRTLALASRSTDLVQHPDALREALEELGAHQEELAVADEEMRAQLDELSLANARVHGERDRYRELFDVAPDAYFVTDRLGVIRDANTASATMLGIERRFLLGKPLAALVDAADSRELRDALGALRTKPSADVEVRFKPRSGEPRSHAVKGVSVEQNSALLWIARDVQRYHDDAAALSSTNEVLGVDAAARTRDLERANRDKSELLERERRLRAHLEEEHAAKDRFFSVLSHDLRAPLNAVVGWTQLLRREKLDERARDRALAVIERSAQAQLRLIEELLDISRVAADRAPLERAPVDLSELAQRAVGGAAAEAAERRVELRFTRGDEALLVAGDRRRLEQVTNGLLSNALKFTRAGGTIALTVTHDGASARLEVSDSGHGIAQDRLPHVFEAFRHLNIDPATTYDGLGLGLYVVRQITAESAGVGQGARFVVSLPLASVTRARAEAHAPAGPSSPQPMQPDLLDGVRVLVVDDDEDSRELMAAIMRHRGAIVTIADGLAAALQAFSLSQPDVLLSDLSMPGGSGLELARELRSRPTTTATMIAISGFTSPAEVDRAFDAGFDMHLAKPLDPDSLVHAVHDAARLRVH